MRSILIVEDEPLVRLFLEEILHGMGFEVFSAETALAGVSLVAEKAALSTGLITDIELGDRTSGWELARYARSLNPELHIIYISGRCADGWASEGVPRSEFIQKPFSASLVLRVLSSLLNDDSENVA